VASHRETVVAQVFECISEGVREMFFLAVFTSSRIIEYTPDRANLLKPRNPPTLALYFMTNTMHYIRELRIFEYTSTLLYDTDFVTVNCSTYLQWCIDHQIEPLPLIKLFWDPRPHELEMTNEHAPYAIVEFATSNSRAKSLVRETGNLQELNEDNWTQFVIQNKWRIVGFMNPEDRPSILLYPTMHELADIFAEEKDMMFGLVNCTGDYSFCRSLGIRAAPIVRVYQGPVWKDYTGYRELEFLLPWINAECGKRRKFDRTIEVRETIEEFESVLGDFLKAPDRKKFIEEFTPHDGQELYLPVMNKIAKNGIAFFEKDIENCVHLLGKANLRGEPRARVEEQLHVLRQVKKIVDEIRPEREL
jgi:hypothetical protein